MKNASQLIKGALVGAIFISVGACGQTDNSPKPDNTSFQVRNACPMDAADVKVERLGKSEIAKKFPKAKDILESQDRWKGRVRAYTGSSADLKEELTRVFRIFRVTMPSISDSTDMLFTSGFHTAGCKELLPEGFLLEPLANLKSDLALEKCDLATLRQEVEHELDDIAQFMGSALKAQFKIRFPRAAVLPRLFVHQDDGTYSEIFVSFQTEVSPKEPGQDVSNLSNPFNIATVLISNSDCSAKGSAQFFGI